MSLATATLYETDFYGWTQRQVDAMRAGNLADLDLNNLIEEVESMGKNQKKELESRLEVLLMHLLKWRYQPNLRGRSWQLTIIEQRKRIAYHLEENPSLKSRIPEAHNRSYAFSVMDAVKETGMADSIFPEQCPWTFEQVMNPDFWPEATLNA